MSVPNRAEHPNRKIGDMTTPLHDKFNETATGVKFDIYKKDAQGRVGEAPNLSPQYEVRDGEAARKAGEDTRKLVGSNATIHGTYIHPEGAIQEEAAKRVAQMKSTDTRFNPEHKDYLHSGTDRFMVESKMHQDAVANIKASQRFTVY